MSITSQFIIFLSTTTSQHLANRILESLWTLRKYSQHGLNALFLSLSILINIRPKFITSTFLPYISISLFSNLYQYIMMEQFPCKIINYFLVAKFTEPFHWLTFLWNSPLFTTSPLIILLLFTSTKKLFIVLLSLYHFLLLFPLSIPLGSHHVYTGCSLSFEPQTNISIFTLNCPFE